MPHDTLYQKILDEAAAQRRRAPRRSPHAGVAPGRLSNAAPAVKGLSLRELAAIIEADWRPVQYGAQPYLEAIKECDGDEAVYGPARESAASLVLYFLSNARSWRGPTAKAVKAELRRRFA